MPDLMPAPLPLARRDDCTRPNLWRVADPLRLVLSPKVPPGSVHAVPGGIAFAVAPGEFFLRYDDPSVSPPPHETALVTSCSDSFLEWQMTSSQVLGVIRAYGAFAATPSPGMALALAIARERGLIVLPQSGAALVYLETALADWFAQLLGKISD
jgi:hypothetical protein